jgi:hypothetical protein
VTQPNNDRRDDPDAQGLPPDIELPEPVTYRRNQLLARLVVSLVGLGLLLLLLAGEPDSRVVQFCVAAVSIVAVFHLVRWLKAR